MKGKMKTQVWYPRAAEYPNTIFMNSCHVRYFIINLLSWASAFCLVASRILWDRSHVNRDGIIHLLQLAHFTPGVPAKALFLCWYTLDSSHGRVNTADMPFNANISGKLKDAWSIHIQIWYYKTSETRSELYIFAITDADIIVVLINEWTDIWFFFLLMVYCMAS